MTSTILLFGGCSEPSAVPMSDIAFSGQVQPIFDANCSSLGCHNNTDAASGLRLTSYESLLAGSNFGAVVIPFRPDQSSLYFLLTGTGSPRMPLDLDPLQEDVIQLVRRWIEEGAQNDR